MRNSHNGVYEPEYAQRLYDQRRSEINKWRCKLKKNPIMVEEIRRCMMMEMRAPHVIAGRKKNDWEEMVCATTIFDYINTREPSLKVYLKYKKWYKDQYGW